MKNAWASFTVGMILGIAATISFKWFNEQVKPTNEFEIHSLPNDAMYPALKINRTTGETWGLTVQGRWFKIQEFKIADPMEWLKDQGYAPDKFGKWGLTNKSNSN
jgi:hypothetical protein